MQRRYRLRHTADFERLRREGRVFRHPLMLVSLAQNHLPYNRYGFIVSKRIGRAVVRNRVRRLMREAVHLLHPRLRAGYDVVLIARRPIVGQPFQAVRDAVYLLFDRGGIVVEDEDHD
ncbi:MAG: ribonuclease P protein component [Chloroflexi bacterium]|nr:MAG: ribonuclease P protein component [Chloroflexota bacterium]